VIFCWRFTGVSMQ
jgi:hypothetical protein